VPHPVLLRSDHGHGKSFFGACIADLELVSVQSLSQANLTHLRVQESVVKMVQSAILGFPRMGVNRDLKKATEACEFSLQSVPIVVKRTAEMVQVSIV
jgi:hypothetical protein